MGRRRRTRTRYKYERERGRGGEREKRNIHRSANWAIATIGFPATAFINVARPRGPTKRQQQFIKPTSRVEGWADRMSVAPAAAAAAESEGGFAALALPPPLLPLLWLALRWSPPGPEAEGGWMRKIWSRQQRIAARQQKRVTMCTIRRGAIDEDNLLLFSSTHHT